MKHFNIYYHRLTYIRNFCTKDREHDDLDKASEIFESICTDGKKDPIIVVSNKRFVACFQKISFELMR